MTLGLMLSQPMVPCYYDPWYCAASNHGMSMTTPIEMFGYDDSDGLINSRTQTIKYNAFKKASELIDTVDNDAYRLDIAYGLDGQRWSTVLQKNDDIVKTIIFGENYEKINEPDVTKESSLKNN